MIKFVVKMESVPKKQIKNVIPHLIFLLVSIALTYIFFHKLGKDELIFGGDQFFRFSFFETVTNSFFIRKSVDLGSHNSWVLAVQFWDILYYLFAHKIGLSLLTMEKILFFTVLLGSLYLSFWGFRKLNRLFDIPVSYLALIPITLWYCFNPYTLALWHGGVYNIGSGLSYSLAPLILYHFHLSIFTPAKFKNFIVCALLMFVASFTFWLFAPLLFFLVLYGIWYTLIHKEQLLKTLKRVAILLLTYLPLSSVILFVLLNEYLNNASNINSVRLPTYGHQQGGLWYQSLLLFSWGMYTKWTPRSLYPFADYFFSIPYKISTLTIYALILIGTFKPVRGLKPQWKLKSMSKLTKLIVVLIIILVFSLFFAKAAQPPLGEIFVFLFENVPFFSVFRTADIRFGFPVVLTISLLLILVSHRYSKRFFSMVVIGIICTQSIILLNGTAVLGENKGTEYYDRVIHIPQEYKDLAEFLNNDSAEFGYILTIPPVWYGHYKLGPSEHHFGQDLLPKLIKHPFTYISRSGGIYTKSYEKLLATVESKDFQTLKKFPIQYVVLRRDTVCKDCRDITQQDIEDKFDLVFKNDTFSVYKIDDYSPILTSSNTKFKVINPTKYRVQFTNITEPQQLNFLMSYNKYWKLFLNKSNRGSTDAQECKEDIKFFEGEELTYLWEEPIFDNTHDHFEDYANTWSIDPQFIKSNFSPEYYSQNADGSINFELVVYFRPQSQFYLSVLATGTALLAAGLYILGVSKRRL